MANYVIESRTPGANRAWTNIAPIRSFKLRKEVNVLWKTNFIISNPAIASKNGQALYYDMDTLTADGKMKDQSTGGNHGTITGATDVAGKYGRARTFSAAGDKISPGNVLNFGTGPFTVVGWLKTTSAAAIKVWASKWTLSGTARGWACYMSNSGQLFAEIEANGTSSSNIGGTVINDGNYHHAACVFDRNGSTQAVLSIYVDGVLVGGPTTFTGQNGSVDNSTNLEIGNAGANQWVGDIDEVYIYNQALSPNDVKLAMNASLQDLLDVDNEVRIRETVANKEYFRGRIRDVTNNTNTKDWTVYAYDNAVLVQDRRWRTRRNFPPVPAGTILWEILTSAEREPKNGQVLYYDMETQNQTTGRMLDLTGNNGDAFINFGGGSANVTGKLGLAWHFATGDALNIISLEPMPEFTGKYSLACWVNLDNKDATTRRFRLVSHITGFSGYRIELKSDNTNQQIDMTNGDGGATTTATVTLSGAPLVVGEWHHLAIVYDQTSLKVSVDGGTFQTAALTRNPVSNVGSDLFIGLATAGTIQNLSIDEYVLYNRDLSSTDINILMGKSPLAGSTGTIDTFTNVAFRADESQRLSLVDAYARSIAGEWYVNQNGSDQDQLNLRIRIGSVSATDTFQFGKTAVLANRKIDTDTLVNDFAVVGNDSIKQLKSRNFNATTVRSTLNADLRAGDTSIVLVDASAFPTSGTGYCGMERLSWTGKTSNTLTTVSHAVTSDGYESLAAYTHTLGVEFYLHKDGGTGAYYTPENPQSGSSIQINGWRQSHPYTDQGYSDQNGLDRLAQRFRTKYDASRESLMVDVRQPSVLFDIGDNINLNDTGGSAFGTSPYRVYAFEFSYPAFVWYLELTNYRDTFDRRMTETTQQNRAAGQFVSDAATKGNQFNGTSVITLTTTTEKAIIVGTTTGIAAGTKVQIVGWAQLTTGAGTTTVMPRIRQGSGIAGRGIGGANAINAAASQTLQFNIHVFDIPGIANPTYTFTLQQAGATANGSALQYNLSVTPVG